ncbi:MAG: response regulator [Spirochaetales bacterium]|nr:response regulator [Spirochaetales bacterium]
MKTKICPGIITILILLIYSFFFNCTTADSRPVQPVAEKGIIDLRKWDFEKNGFVNLAGEWEFYWNRILLPEDFFSGKITPELSGYIKIPHDWTGYKVNGEKISGKGYGTFRLRILHRSIEKSVLLRVEEIYSAADIFVNSIKCDLKNEIKVGNKSDVPRWRPRTVPISFNSTETEIIINVSNYNHVNGGITGDIKTGLFADIMNQRDQKILQDLVIIGGILIIGFYYIIFFLLRVKDKAPLLFGILCIILAIRTFARSENELPVSVFLEMRIIYITFFFSFPVFSAFFYLFFRQPHVRFVFIIMSILSFISAFIVLIFPPEIYVHTIGVFLFFLLLFCIYIIVCLIIAVSERKDGAISFLTGFILLAGITVNDVLHLNQVIKTGFYIHYGLFIFIFSQAIGLAKKFSNSFKTAEYLSENLQIEVDNKTRELTLITRKAIDAKTEIEKMSRQKTDFFVNLTHETKTPLTLIKFYFDRYIKTHGDPEDLHIVKQNIEKLQRDMVNFLDSEKLIKGQIFYNHDQSINVSQMLQQKIVLFKEIAGKKNIVINSDIMNDLYIKSDSFAFDRIINNLLDNAIKYTGEHGTINVSLVEKDNAICLIVKDNGIGISEERLNVIYDPYYQLSHKKRNIQGIGMGLFIVKKIVESLDAKIDIESALDKGTAFTITFKKLEINNKQIEQDTNDVSSPLHTGISMSELKEYGISDKKYNILIVEDNYDLLRFMQTEMANIFNVYIAGNGKQGLEKLTAIPKPEVIISDIMMDEMDGYEFLNKLKQKKEYSDIPLIFLTAKTSITEKIKGLSEGAIDYVFKPFTMEEINTKIHSIIRNNNIRRLLYEKDKYASLGMLLSGISHEILNPLSAINAPLVNLKNYLSSLEIEHTKTDNYINTIEANSKRISTIIKNLKMLYYSNEVAIEKINLKSFIEPIKKIFAGKIKERITITSEIDPDFEIPANKNLLRQIIINLISNAIDAIKQDGNIIVESGTGYEKKTISIIDNGIGMDEKQKARIFDAFYTTKDIGKGTGLGLFIVKDLVLKLGWNIEVDSKPDRGSRFTLIIKGENES